MNSNKVFKILSGHDHICSTIYDLNRFCSKFYFINFVTLIPCTIFIIPLIPLMEPAWILVVLLALVSCWSFIFFVTFLTATLTKNVTKSKAEIYKFQWKMKGNRVELKMKLLSLYERISSSRKLIGFSVLNLFVMNYPRFGLLVLTYWRFVFVIFKRSNKI